MIRGRALARVRRLTDLRHWGAHARSRPSARLVRVLASLRSPPSPTTAASGTWPGTQMAVQSAGVTTGTWASRYPARAGLRPAAVSLTYHTDRTGPREIDDSYAIYIGIHSVAPSCGLASILRGGRSFFFSSLWRPSGCTPFFRGAHARSRPSARIVRVLAALPTIPNHSGIGNLTGVPRWPDRASAPQ